MGILAEAIREIASEKIAAEDEARQALEDFDIITSRAIDTARMTIAALQLELLAAGWWSGELNEDSNKPEYLRLSLCVRRHAANPAPATNPDYLYSIRFDGLGSAERSTGDSDPLLEPLVLRGVARQDFRMDIEKDLKLFLKAILRRH